MIEKIQENPFLSLGVANLVVALLFFDVTTGINPFSVTFMIFAAFAFLLNFIQYENVKAIRVNPTTGSKELIRISKRKVNKFIKTEFSEVGKFVDPERDGLFLGNAQNVYTPVELEEMSRNENPRIQAFVALNTLTPVKTLEELSRSSNHGVLNAVASNPRTPKDIRTSVLYGELMDISSEEAQVELLTNKSTPGFVLRKIYTKPFNESLVNEYLAGHPNTPKDVFNEITNGDNVNVLVAIAKSPTVIGNEELISRLRGRKSYDIAEAFLTNPSMDSKTLDMFGVDSVEYSDMSAVLRNPTLPLSVSTMAWCARNAPIFRPVMVTRIKQEKPELADVSTDSILKLF